MANGGGSTDDKKRSAFAAFWTSLPGVLTGIAAIVETLVTLGIIGANTGQQPSTPPESNPGTTQGSVKDNGGAGPGTDNRGGGNNASSFWMRAEDLHQPVLTAPCTRLSYRRLWSRTPAPHPPVQ